MSGAVEFNKKVYLKGKRRVYWWAEHTKWRGNVKDNEAHSTINFGFIKQDGQWFFSTVKKL